MKKKVNKNNLNGRYGLLLELIDRIPDVIYFKDRQGRFVLVNKAHAKGLGLKPEQVVGKTDFDIFSKERAELMVKDDEYVMKTGKPIIDKVERATRPDGIDNYVSTTKMPRFDSKGKVVGIMGITRDITRRMQLERAEKEKEDIEKKVSSLEEVNRIKSEFVSIVSHELRTPLAIIKEAVSLILDNIAGPVNDKQKELLTKTEENAERLKKIIDDLLDISRIEGKRLSLHYSLADLKDLIKDTAEFFIKLSAQKGINLEYRLPDKEVNIFIDSERIRQVVSNLINNAIKFTEEDGRIAVELDVLETTVRIKVSDTGVGINSSDLPKLFNKFIQVSKDAFSERKGVGLGLAISKELVELHGGRMWAKSQLGVGSQFYFTLPLLYTRHVLPDEMRGVVNGFLEKNILLSLIDLFIVNYDKFNDIAQLNPQRINKDLNELLNKACVEISESHKAALHLFAHDSQSGEFSIVLPEIKKDDTEDICASLSSRVGKYFKENNVNNVFTKIDILSWPFQSEKSTSDKNQLLNLYMKKILVGLEVRRFERIPYKMKLEMDVSRIKKEATHTIDISQGGLCFEGKNYLEKDARIDIGLNIPRRKIPIRTKARVAWIRNVEGVAKDSDSRYRAGLEFLSLNSQEKKIISGFLDSVSAAKKS